MKLIKNTFLTLILVFLPLASFFIAPVTTKDAQADYSYSRYYDSRGNRVENERWDSNNDRDIGRITRNNWLNRNNWHNQNYWLANQRNRLSYSYNNRYYGNYSNYYYNYRPYSMWSDNYYNGNRKIIWANSGYPLMPIYNTSGLNNWYGSYYGNTLSNYSSMLANGVAIVDRDNPNRAIIIMNTNSYVSSGLAYINRASVSVDDATFNRLSDAVQNASDQLNLRFDYGNNYLMYNSPYGTFQSPAIISLM